ncbi:MAG: DNA polymerase III subunit delta [Bacteroidaceae bacterium]|nr:DNA polymerase III subunit delta [Bacteroidaceae bacterium]
MCLQRPKYIKKLRVAANASEDFFENKRFFCIFAHEMQVEDRLKRLVSGQRMPQALLLAGSNNSDALAMGLRLARALLCEKQNGEICEDCPECHMSREWAHPDLHFTLPVYKKNTSDHPTTDPWLPLWRDLLKENGCPKLEDWMGKIKAENQQLTIYVNESDLLQQKLQLHASRGGRRVVLIWLPERLMEQAANKLLKLIEEPPAKTHFILVTEEPEKVLGTIQSRCQRIDVPDREQRIGSEEERLFFDLFVQLMRLAYGRKIRELRAWSETTSRLGREKQCRMLSYFQHLLRDNFIYNLKQPEMISLTEEENQFSGKFARFINENNIIPIAEETDRAQRDITQNVNARMVFFDYALHIIVLLIQ